MGMKREAGKTQGMIHESYGWRLPDHPSRFLRDLVWVLLSPPLIDETYGVFQGLGVTEEWSASLYRDLLPHLHDLFKDPSPLDHWILSRSHQRLGRYVESLMAYALQHCPRFADIHQGIVIKDKQRSLGELDFVYRDLLTGQQCHLEIAVKFYLRLEGGRTLDSFLGHQGGDRLSHKIDLMVKKQIPLSDRYFQETLGDGVSNLQGAVKKMMLVKGYLFGPRSFQRHQEGTNRHNADFDFDPVAGINPQALYGKWVRWSQWDDYLSAEDPCLWMILAKKNWLSPVHKNDAAFFYSGSEITSLLSQQMASVSAAPIQLSQIRQSMGQFKETDRVFVVPDQWAESQE